MIHLLQLAVSHTAALQFWSDRLRDHGIESMPGDDSLRITDPDGLVLELIVSGGDPPLQAVDPEIPAEYALSGVCGARAYRDDDTEDRHILLETLGFSELGADDFQLDGEQRHFRWAYDRSVSRGHLGAGTVHHIAWHSPDDDHVRWQARVADAGRRVTHVIDRDYFLSIYFRMPSGVLFEIATTSPGFAVDEPAEHLGEQLQLPIQHEHLRSQLEQTLRPIRNPRVPA